MLSIPAVILLALALMLSAGWVTAKKRGFMVKQGSRACVVRSHGNQLVSRRRSIIFLLGLGVGSRRSALARPRLSDGVRRMARGFRLHGQSPGCRLFPCWHGHVAPFPYRRIDWDGLRRRYGYLYSSTWALLASILATVMGRTFLKEPVLGSSHLIQDGRLCVKRSHKWPSSGGSESHGACVAFGLQNYALGAVGVRMRDQFWGTLVGMQPALWVALYMVRPFRCCAVGDAPGARVPHNWSFFCLAVQRCASLRLVIRAAGRARDAQPDSPNSLKRSSPQLFHS